MATSSPDQHPDVDDQLIDAIAARLLDRVADRIVAAMKQHGSLSALSSGNGRSQLTLADAHRSEETAVDAVRDAFEGTEIARPPSNAIVWDLTS